MCENCGKEMKGFVKIKSFLNILFKKSWPFYNPDYNQKVYIFMKNHHQTVNVPANSKLYLRDICVL